MANSNNYLVPPDTKVKLADYDPGDTGKFRNKAQANLLLRKHRDKLVELQELMYAEDKHSLLVVLQGMDTAGKDGAISHIFSGVNPQGCRVTSFKQPSTEELRHDFLWRVHRAVPPRGMIGIFNRSHYEEVLVVRVHQNLSKRELHQRFEIINDFEKMLVQNGTTILKFFLHISKDEQKERLQARLDDPAKQWKMNPDDLKERELWNEYQKAYEDVLRCCSTRYAPWYVIPSNHKWYRNVLISQILVDTLRGLKMRYPKPRFDLSKLKVE
jgi:PPK2 family polyphosphate:nucleotide phosphotransferase